MAIGLPKPTTDDGLSKNLVTSIPDDPRLPIDREKIEPNRVGFLYPLRMSVITKLDLEMNINLSHKVVK